MNNANHQTTMVIKAIADTIVDFTKHKITEQAFRAEIKKYTALTTNILVDADEIVNAVNKWIKP